MFLDGIDRKITMPDFSVEFINDRSKMTRLIERRASLSVIALATVEERLVRAEIETVN